MGRWFEYRSTEAIGPGARAGPVVIDAPDSSVGVVLSAHDLQLTTDPDEALAEMARVLRPDGLLLLSVPVFGRETVAPPDRSGDPYSARWQFGVDLTARIQGQGLAVTLMGTDELTRMVSDGLDSFPGASAGGEVDAEGLIDAARALQVVGVADNATVRRSGFRPATQYLAFVGRPD